MSVTQKEIVEAFHEVGGILLTSKYTQLANRIVAEGIAPPDGLALIADIEGIGCCKVTIRNGRVHIAAETVRDIINMGAGEIAPPEGFRLVPKNPAAGGWK